MEASTVHLLWTGGWDSTFRLLQLLEQGRTVQPHYLVDEMRASTGAELRAMRKIKDGLRRRFPERYPRLLPARISAVSDLPPVPEITRAYQSLRQRVYIGSQYEWLGRYCASSGIEWFDAGFHNSGGPTYQLLQSMFTTARADPKVKIIDTAFSDHELYQLFRWYRFTVIDITKRQMMAAARANGTLELMRMTWFCHEPLRNLRPCGVCNPCSFVIEEGMGWRLPASSRLRHYLPGRNLVRRILIRNPLLYSAITRLRSRTRSIIGFPANSERA